MLGAIRGEVRFKEPLAFHTALRIGGVADIFIVPYDLDDLRRALAFAGREGLPVTVLGEGSGSLIGERGVRGVVLRLGGCFGRVDFRGEEALAGAAVPISAVIRAAAARGLGGLERFVGAPASVGGALVRGLTAEGLAIAEVASVIYALAAEGTLLEIKPRVEAAGQARSGVPPDVVVIGARLALLPWPRRDLEAELARRVARARATLPFARAAAGPVWEDAPEGAAADLLRRAHLAGRRAGAAEVSPKDPNFIVNRGGAGAAAMVGLLTAVQARVRARLGVTLTLRLRVIGA